MRRLLTALAMAAPLAAQPGGAIEGVVVNSQTGAGIPGVEVRVWTQGFNFAVGTTDGVGGFRFTNLKPGEYEWSATHADYPRSDDGMHERKERLRVEAVRDPVRLRIELAPAASLRGRVLDPAGKPMPGVRVGFSPGRTVVTDAEGVFALTGLRADNYRLAAMPEPVELAASDGPRIVTVTTFYPSVAEASRAARIAVGAGADLRGYDIQLATAEVYRVRGVVLNADGNRAPRATVSLADTNPYGSMTFSGDSFTLTDSSMDAFSRMAEPAITDEQGVFEFPAVQRAEWRLNAHSEPIYDVVLHRDRSLSGGARVFVTSRDVDDVELRLAPPFNWSGSVDWGNVPETAQRDFAVFLMPVDGGNGGMAKRQPDRSLLVEGLAPGRYRFLPARTGERFYVGSIQMGGTDVTNLPVDVNASTPPFRLVIRDDAGSVRGTVENGEGAVVALLPRGFEIGDVAVHVTAGPGGAFEITGLRPGAYHAFAFPSTEPETDVTVFRNLLPRATGVTVERGGTAMVQLRVISGLR